MASKSSAAQYMMVELKAKVDDLAPIRKTLTQHGADRIGVFHQIDTYYKVPKGRLKLREVKDKVDGELIYYEREDIAKPKRSFDFILKIPQSQVFKQILEQIMETKNIVDKIREIYHYKGIQIHLDKVKDLGSFVEFEYMTSQNPEQRKRDCLKLEKLRERLKIGSQRLESLSYSDLI
jgi:predicted adenylyl cyclase CyaB